jgi:hypothetical protein
MSARTPYDDTSVPVSRSQAQIRDLLKNAGARGVQIEESWEGDGTALVRFLWETKGQVQRIRVKVAQLTEELHGTYKTPDQRERQAWRGVYLYLKSNLEASSFGFIRFEDVFMSFFESDDGRTIGEVVIPQLEAGRLALPKGGGAS